MPRRRAVSPAPIRKLNWQKLDNASGDGDDMRTELTTVRGRTAELSSRSGSSDVRIDIRNGSFVGLWPIRKLHWLQRGHVAATVRGDYLKHARGNDCEAIRIGKEFEWQGAKRLVDGSGKRVSPRCTEFG